MSLMKRALDAARLRLGRLGRKAAGTVIAATANVLPSARGGGKRTFDPIWTGRSRSALRESKTSVSDTTSPSALRLKRQRDRKMREGLPRMSGRQWQRIRKAMYRKAKFLTIQQRQEAGR